MNVFSPTPRPQFDWTVRTDDAARVSTVIASGELDLAAADQLAGTLTRESRMAREIRMDLSRVSFLDAPILGVLVEADQDMRRRSGRLVLTDVPARAQRLFHLTGLEGMLSAAA